MYSVVIRMVPHTAKGLAAIEVLRGKRGDGLLTRIRSRGHRHACGKLHNSWHPYYQDLPRELATHFSVYQSQGTGANGYVKCDYVGTDTNGKIRVRMQP